MSLLPTELSSYLPYAAPPLVGAFIGYLTNKIAIKMLFRPLRPWHLFGLRVPMTPGVIPAKRDQLADNMGEVVGDHLLTSEEIGNGLKEGKFQQHLLNVIADRVGAILHRDLPPVVELIPDKFALYRQLGTAALKKQLRDQISAFMESDQFADTLSVAVEERADILFDTKINDIAGEKTREALYGFVESSLARMFASPAMEEWLEKMFQQQAFALLQQQKSLSEVLPDSLLVFVENGIRSQTPVLLQKLATILREPEVRDSVVRGACAGVQQFVESLGPMSTMVQNFLSMELVDQKVREYLDEKDEEIVNYLSSEDLQQRVGTILSERFANFIAKPLTDIVSADDTETVGQVCRHFASQTALLLRSPEVQSAMSTMLRDNIEAHLLDGDIALGPALTELLGEEKVRQGREWLMAELVALLRSEKTRSTIGNMLDRMVDNLLARPVGKLSRFLPAAVRKEIYVSIQHITSNMLAKEVPGLVESLDIRTIVADKINSLDLLRLERLLLSIMEEQFKYINLFGALLGFLIGCLNLFFLQVG